MISKEKKTAVINEYARFEGDTGSPEVQIAILTARWSADAEHFLITSREPIWKDIVHSSRDLVSESNS